MKENKRVRSGSSYSWLVKLVIWSFNIMALGVKTSRSPGLVV